MTGRKVVTQHTYPPIPWRGCDWHAHFDGYEPGDPLGSGPTEQAAIDDLIEQAEERDWMRVA